MGTPNSQSPTGNRQFSKTHLPMSAEFRDDGYGRATPELYPPLFASKEPGVIYLDPTNSDIGILNSEFGFRRDQRRSRHA